MITEILGCDCVLLKDGRTIVVHGGMPVLGGVPSFGVGLETENEDVWWRQDDESDDESNDGYHPRMRLSRTPAIEVYDLEEQR
jgi:hypothetical protein